MKRLLLSLSTLLAVMTIILSSSLALAQDTGSDNADDNAIVEEPDQAQQQAQVEPSDASAGAIEVAEADEEDDSSARFIPSEEISQDLGVSFPVDI